MSELASSPPTQAIDAPMKVSHEAEEPGRSYLPSSDDHNNNAKTAEKKVDGSAHGAKSLKVVIMDEESGVTPYATDLPANTSSPPSRKSSVSSVSSRRSILQKTALPQVNLKDILAKKTKRPISYNQFKEYIQSEHDEDNLYFWEEVEQFRSKALQHAALTNTQTNSTKVQEDETQELKTTLQNIANKYLKTGAPSELNIAAKSRKDVLQNIEAGNTDPEILTNVQRHIFELMVQNTFMRFLERNTFKNISKSEIKARAMSGHFLLLIDIMLIVLYFTQPIKQGYRFFLYLPTFFTIGSYYQVQQRFCYTYGLMGKMSKLLTGKLGDTEVVAEKCIYRSQRQLAIRMLSTQAVMAIIPPLILYFIPYNIY